MSYRFVRNIAIACVVSAWVSAAWGQMDFPVQAAEKETIAATGFVRIARPPTMLRMHIQLSVKGKSLEDALDKLKTRRETVAGQLVKLGAEKDAISFTNPLPTRAQSEQQHKIEMVIAQRMGKKVKGAKAGAPTVAVMTMLTAQWPLAAEGPEKTLLAAEALREKITAADLAAGKEVEKLSPEEQEVAEETAGAAAEEAAEMMRSTGQEPVLPGQPQFVFVARLSAADREKALAEAFGKAKTQAAELAKAAGVRLGPLVGLGGRGGGRSSGEDFNPYGRNEAMFIQRAMMQQATSGAQAREDETIAAIAVELGFDFYVTATFAMGK